MSAPGTHGAGCTTCGAPRHADGSRDAVTSLGNRRAVVERLGRLLRAEGATTPGQSCGLMLFDIDDFSTVNEMLGHQAGDQLLRAVAARLGEVASCADLVARLSADTFCVLLDRAGTTEELSQLSSTIASGLAEPFLIEGYSLVVRASCGVRAALVGENAETVLRDAEEALAQARSSGRGRSVLFDSAGPGRVDRRRFEAELREAVLRSDLVCHYQPVIDLASGAVSGAEALVRWSHPERGMVPPVEFIGLAEEIGIVDLLTDHVLSLACAQAAAWRSQGGHHLVMHVNLSGHDLADPRLARRVESALVTSGLDASGLCLEITESALVSNDLVAQENLVRLREAGLRFAIDDFGVEYASFGYLRKFPVEVLKIDRSFVEGIDTDARDRSVLVGLVGLAKALGMRTVAEGVESAAQAHVVRELGVDEAQGWFFGRPVPGEALPVSAEPAFGAVS